MCYPRRQCETLATSFFVDFALNRVMMDSSSTQFVLSRSCSIFVILFLILYTFVSLFFCWFFSCFFFSFSFCSFFFFIT